MAKVKHLVYKIEELGALSSVRRRLFLMTIYETIEIEVELLSKTIDQLRSVDKQYTAIETRLSKTT